jgi:VWFA-related protein
MRSAVVCLAGWILCLVGLVHARQDRPAQTFRGGVDLIQLDVSVLDRDRRPVQGLTAGDFTVLVDGLPRPIVAYRVVDLPRPVPPSAPWIRDIAPDVASNTHPRGRVVVIMIDDGSFGQVNVADLTTVHKARKVAVAAVNELGSDDLAAVVFTENNHTAQNFTTDRRRLIEAIEKSAMVQSPGGFARPDSGALPVLTGDQAKRLDDPMGILHGSCSCGLCSIEALSRVSDALVSMPQQRKTVIYISVGRAVQPDMAESPQLGRPYDNLKLHCDLAGRLAMTEVFRQAQLANVTIQAVDPKGVAVAPGGDPLTNPVTLRTEFLRTMAETTGGRAVVNVNDMEQQVPAVLAESSSYYLLGVESAATKDDGRFHPIQVRVNRPGLEVRTRSGFYAPTAKARKAMGDSPSGGLEASISGAVPKSDFPMEVVVSPFAGAGSGKADLAIVLAVTHPHGVRTTEGTHAERVEVLASAFNPETGKAVGSGRQTLNVVWNPNGASGGQYEVMQRLPLPAGRYELRLGAKTADDRTASVYTYVDVPDFSREPLSLSGLILSAMPSPTAAKDTFKDLLPVAPTARRTFRSSDRVTAFLRVYQGGAHPLMPATITTRLIDSRNAQLGGGVRKLDVTDFAKARLFDNQFDLPVRLPQGEYLLTVDVAAGGSSAQRTVRFRVL